MGRHLPNNKTPLSFATNCNLFIILAYGKWGYYLLSLLQFMYPFLGKTLKYWLIFVLDDFCVRYLVDRLFKLQIACT